MDSREIVERRRLRRLAERRRRVRARRRNALGSIATLALVGAIVVGAAGDDAGPAGGAGVPAELAEQPVPTVGDFSGPVPILMYHAIADAPDGAAYPELFVSPSDFSAQIAAMRDAGLNAVTLRQVFAAWQDGAPIPRDPIVLTFDDGLRSQYSEALPVLRRAGWPAVLNLKVESLDQGELTDEMVDEMLAAGWELASHTVSHLDLTELSGEELRREVAGSRRLLANRFDVAVDFFCYPAGRYDKEAIEAVQAAGYIGATTTDPGLAFRDAPFELARIRIDAADGTDGLIGKLSTAGVEVG